MAPRIELLSPHHDRSGFDCGEAALNEFLRRYAGQQQRLGFGKTYVALSEDGMTVSGFVTVSVGQIAAEQLPGNLRLPRYPVPMLRIGRLAVSIHSQGRGIGRDLLAFALKMAVAFSQRAGLYAVVVDAKHEKAKAFYTRLGFTTCENDPLCLYLPVATLKKAVDE